MCSIPVYATSFFASLAVRDIVSIQTSSKKIQHTIGKNETGVVHVELCLCRVLIHDYKGTSFHGIYLNGWISLSYQTRIFAGEPGNAGGLAVGAQRRASIFRFRSAHRGKSFGIAAKAERTWAYRIYHKLLLIIT